MRRTQPAKRLLAALAILAATTGSAFAQVYPQRPITIIVPWPPGGSVDASARALGKELTQLLGQPIVIDNRGGAAGSVGSGIGARAPRDGYTLTFGNATSHATDVVTITTLNYDPIKDFAAISLVHKSTMSIAVPKSSPIQNLQDFLTYAKANPGTPYGSPGIGSPQHLIGELLNLRAGLRINHVPYRGGGPVVSDLVGGHIPVAIGGLSQFLQLHERGDVRVIAIADERRHPALPNIPTLSEVFPDIRVSGWGALYAPTGTDEAILKPLGDAVRKSIASNDFQNILEASGLTPAASTAEELVQLMQTDVALWRDLAGKGIKLQE